ncbi:MAG: CYCXC family (seleno)protein [Candidatus Acidiferrales bacterium]
MRKTSLVAVIFIFIIAGFGFGLLHAQEASQPPAQQAAQEKSRASDVPAYHATRSKEPLPDTLDPSQFRDQQTKSVYALAAKVKNVLYQQPCYCHCDKEIGHTSLLSCYTDRHASVCALCQKEAVLAYTETQKGKTPAQIRKEIIEGKWKDVDLSVYETPAPSN